MPTRPRSTTTNTVKAGRRNSSPVADAAEPLNPDPSPSKAARALVIVESPAKAKTINKYLGREYIVKSSVGHVRDLPVSGGGKTDKEDSKPAARGNKPPKPKPPKHSRP